MDISEPTYDRNAPAIILGLRCHHDGAHHWCYSAGQSIQSAALSFCDLDRIGAPPLDDQCLEKLVELCGDLHHLVARHRLYFQPANPW
jgi:hypothetical protein